MEEHQPRNLFDIPAVFYFEVGNTHYGSRGTFRFRVKPSDGKLLTETWAEDLCYDIAKERGIIRAEGEFPLTEEGFQQMIAFLRTEYDKCGDSK